MPAGFDERPAPVPDPGDPRHDAAIRPAPERAATAGDAPIPAIGGGPFPAPEPAAAQAEASAVQQGFLAECVAGNLAASTTRIATGMNRLRLIQDRIRGALQDNDALLETYDGADLEEELEAASAVAASVGREANSIADVAKRLASSTASPDGDGNHDMIDVNECINEVLRTTGAEATATVARKLGTLPEIFASRAEIRLLLEKIIENSVHAVADLDDRTGTIKIDTARKNDEDTDHHHRQRSRNPVGSANQDFPTLLHFPRRRAWDSDFRLQTIW